MRPMFAIVVAVLAAPALAAVDAAPDVHGDATAIFQARCFSCHGPDGRQGGLTLTSRDALLLGGDSGEAVIVPGDSGASPLMHRVRSGDPAERMPPDGPRLNDAEIDAVARWIDAGAPWPGGDSGSPDRLESSHWAFQPPVQNAPPTVSRPDWARNPIDAFVLAALDERALAPSPEADRATLIRRLSLDLTGLPPTPDEVAAFVNDTRPDAYERLVDRLLASPHYGERQAIRWLDAARYADTNGYEKDRARSIWPWRDWVINAFNEDMPFDRFTVEQLAGDLLPNATPEQRIATGFLRNSAFNEEGGVDVEEFRYEAVVDRTNTVGTVFLGLTMACAQCHTHKYDPVTQREYFQFLAFLNNQDDVEIEVTDPAIAAERLRIQSEIDAFIADLAHRFPLEEPDVAVHRLEVIEAQSEQGAALRILEDGSVIVSADAPDTDTYTVDLSVPADTLTALRLDVLPDAALPDGGPGLAENGNFVLSNLRVERLDGDGKASAAAIRRVRANQEQDGFPASSAIDGKRSPGWAVNVAGKPLNTVHTATFTFEEPLHLEPSDRVRVTLEQHHGKRHLLGRFRLTGLREFIPLSDEPEDERRRGHLARRLAAWEASVTPNASAWSVLEPVHYTSQNPTTFRKLNDRSLLLAGDIPNNDTYTVEYFVDAGEITAIRLEVLPHESLPGGGPGRGVILAEGDFLLSGIALEAAPWDGSGAWRTLELSAPTANYSAKGRSIKETLDGEADTGWSIKGREGEAHQAVWQVAGDSRFDGPVRLRLTLDQRFIHQHTIGRFRFAVTGDDRPITAAGVPGEVEAILVTPEPERSEAQRSDLQAYFLSIAPELEDEHRQIQTLKAARPSPPTTLALAEREDRRITRIHHRGEFLSPRGAVTPDVPAVLPPLPDDRPKDRLTFAHWIVSAENPLTARVAVNRTWEMYFGRALVNTPEDFGLRGESPSHPELLDWLAVEFVRRGWSVKELTRLIVTSSTYRQSSEVTPVLREADPVNQWLARGPRFRMDAELLRDNALAASGLLHDRIGGPSVFPPMPSGVLDLAYDGGGWKTTEGEDQFRRGLYTFWKRTVPYPTATVFDAPLRDTACVQRPRSNTPLQALTLLNDQVFFEAARAMARRVLHESPDDVNARINRAFALVLAREADAQEQQWIRNFYDRQLQRFAAGDADAATVAGEFDGDAGWSIAEQAAWTAVCRVLLNLDEAITRT